MEALGPLIPLIGIVLIFWLLIIRPAKNKQRQHAAVVNAAEPGSEVMLASGVFGEIVAVRDDEIDLRVAPEVVVRVHRQAIGRVIEPVAEEPTADED